MPSNIKVEQKSTTNNWTASPLISCKPKRPFIAYPENCIGLVRNLVHDLDQCDHADDNSSSTLPTRDPCLLVRILIDFHEPSVEILCFHVVIDDVPRTRLPVITYDENKENTPCMVTSSHKHLLDDEDDDLVDPRFSVHASNKRHYSLLLSR